VLLLPSTADENKKKNMLRENLTNNVKVTHLIEERWPNEPVIWGPRQVERGSPPCGPVASSAFRGWSTAYVDVAVPTFDPWKLSIQENC